MDQWDVIRSLARAKRREIDEHARSERAFDLVSAAAEVTQIKCIPVPKDDPLLYGSDAVLAAEDKRIRYNKEVDPLILSGYLIHEYAHYWIEGELVSCTEPDFEARLRDAAGAACPQSPAGQFPAGVRSEARTVLLDVGGQVLSSHLGGSSGNPTFDARALAMVRQAQPFPAIPPEMPQGSMGFSVPVAFVPR